MDEPAEASTHEEELRGWDTGQMCPPLLGPALGSLPPSPRLGPSSLPFQVFQQEEKGDEVGVGQGAEQVHHAVFLGSRVRQGCGESVARAGLGSQVGRPEPAPPWPGG